MSDFDDKQQKLFNTMSIEALANTVKEVETNSQNFDDCYENITNTTEVFFLAKQQGVKALSNALDDPNIKIVVLAMLYLGMLHIEGVDASKAINRIEGIGDKYKHSEKDVVYEISLGVRAMLNDEIADFSRRLHMKKLGMGSDVQAYNVYIVEKVVRFLAKK